MKSKAPRNTGLPTATSPADVVIAAFGGIRATARAIGVAPPSITYWRSSGTIPTKRVHEVLAAASNLGIKLTLQDVILGR